MAYLDNNGVLYLWSKIKSYVSTAINAIVIPSKTSELTNDSGFITSDDVPEGAAASTTTPKMDGTAAVGSETAFARGDHRHPTDTSRASASDLTSHTGNTTVHITSTERTSWNGKYAKPSGGIPKSDLASDVQTSLGKANTALQPAALQAALDDNVPPVQFVLVRNGNTLSTVDAFVDIAFSLSHKSRRIMFLIALSQSNGAVTSALELYPTMIDSNNRALTLVGEYDGDRYTAELTAASVSSTMTGTLVVEPIVTASDIPGASTSTPAMDGTAAVGSETAFARGDHVHPSDTSKVDKVSGYGIISKTPVTNGYQLGIRENGAVTDFQVVSLSAYNNGMQQAMTALNGKADASALDNYALKTDIASMYKYKGSVATVSALPSSDNTTGDVYNVESTGMNYAWNGTAWDALGESFKITAITNAELDSICT